MGLKNFIADLFHLYPDEDYNELLSDYERVLEENEQLKREKEYRFTPKKIKKNIYSIGRNRFQVRIQIGGRRYQSPFLHSIDEAEVWLEKLKVEHNASPIQE